MKKTLFTLALAFAAMAAQAKDIKTVVFTTNPQMQCENCENKIKGNLKFETGVKEITTNVEKQTVSIKYDADKTSESKLAEAFTKFGYKATKTSGQCQKQGSCCKEGQQQAGQKSCCKEGQQAGQKSCCKEGQQQGEKKSCCKEGQQQATSCSKQADAKNLGSTGRSGLKKTAATSTQKTKSSKKTTKTSTAKKKTTTAKTKKTTQKTDANTSASATR